MPAEEREALKKRVEAFKHAARRGQPTPPLVLSSDDLNALIEDNPKADLKGKVYVTIEKDRLKGQVSLPLSQIPLFGLTQGRYLNGEAEFNVRLIDGRPFVTIEDLEVNGKRPSEAFLAASAARTWPRICNWNPRPRRRSATSRASRSRTATDHSQTASERANLRTDKSELPIDSGGPSSPSP